MLGLSDRPEEKVRRMVVLGRIAERAAMRIERVMDLDMEGDQVPYRKERLYQK